MENTALNGTATTEDHEDWKKKKGYGPIIVAVSLALLLGFSFYLGGHLGGGTTLYRDKKETQNVAASSSSTSLMGSDTATSDLKTLTIEIDDDATVDGLLSGWLPAEKRMGGSSAYCKKNTGYNCGAVFPPNGNTCNSKGCCCREEDGTGMKYNTCDSAKGYAYRGCNSCLGKDACFKTNNINAGTYSCHGNKACRDVSDSTIANDSCSGESACSSVQNSTIQDGSCRGYGSCFTVKNSIIGTGSCTEGRYVSLQGHRYSCSSLENIKIGNNSCNGGGVYTGGVCYHCKHDVPDNACNQGITDDMDSNGFCKYCGKSPY